MNYKLHLNGGPRDDTYIVHWAPILFIAGAVALSPALLSDGATAELSIKQGAYATRMNFIGEPVPHNLDGWVECDWVGWA